MKSSPSAMLFWLAVIMGTAMAAPLYIPSPRNYPAQDTFSLQGGRWVTNYAADSLLQARSLLYMDRYRPEGAVLAVCDLKSGIIMALAERDASGSRSRPRMALEATFPAASLIKILTASAALESNSLHPLDSLPLLGRSHTLYHFQLLPPKVSRYPKISLENAFARSVNPVFGVLGLRIGAVSLRKMGAALGFNQSQSLPGCSPSRLQIPDSGFGLAEVACGYTTSTTLSPLHALRIAQGVGGDGRMHPLFFTPGLRNLNDGSRFAVSTAPGDPFISAAALDNLRTLMAATIESGTARKGFRRAFGSRSINGLDLGGKTGSLDGSDPPGRYEWYIGYARLKEKPGQGIAVVAMVINQRQRMVRASELAALMIRDWAHIPPAPARARYKKIRHPAYARR